MLHRRLRLIGYIRTGGSEYSADKQRLMIEESCATHDWRLIGFSETDTDKPSFGLQEAMDSLQQADGIIAVDLNKFVGHPQDRLFDLRPVYEHLRQAHKALITVTDGIETITAFGQGTLFELLNDWSERDCVRLPIKGDFASSLSGHM